MNPITTTQLENTQTMTLPSSITAPVPDINSFTTTTPQMQEQQTQVNRAKKQQTDTLGNIFTGLTALGERGATQIQMEENAGIGTMSKELVDIENQIRQTDLDFRRQREAVMSRPGLTMASANAELSQLARTQNSQLADLEVIRQARSNSLTNAQSLIDKKVELEFGDKKAKVDALKFIYDENKDLLSKEEDKLLSETIRREERAFNLAKSSFEKVENSKLEFVKNASLSGAPNSVLTSIMQSKTIEEAIQRAGKYVADPLQLASLAKANMEMAKISAEIKAGGAGGLGGKPLSGDASKVLSIATTVQPEIEKLKQVFSQNYKKSVKGIVLGTDRELVKLVDNVADKVGRLRSGGAINKDEETRFKRQIASLMDIPFGTSEGAITALDGILTEAQQVAQGINPYATKLEDAVNDPLGLGISITNENPLGI